MTVVNIRGTNGSGKGYVVKRLMSKGTCISRYGLLGARIPEAYCVQVTQADFPIYVLGPYQATANESYDTGGCDRIQPYDKIITLLNKYVDKGNIVFEGSLVSDNYGKIGEWLEKRGREAVVAFLTTPLKDCLSQLRGRTEGAGVKHVEKRYNAVQKVRGKFLAGGKVTVLDISSSTGAETILKCLRGG